MTLGKWVKKARESGRVPDKELSEPERAELERLRKEIVTLALGARTGVRMVRMAGRADVEVAPLLPPRGPGARAERLPAPDRGPRRGAAGGPGARFW